MIKEIYSETEIEELLKEFSPYLYTLRLGIVDKHSFAKKLKKYGRVIVLYKNDKIIGFAAFYCNNEESKEAFLTYIAVKEDFSKQGYGKKLIDEVFKIAKQCGMITIKLEVRKNNETAIAFYKKIGFNLLTQKNEQSVYFSRDL